MRFYDSSKADAKNICYYGCIVDKKVDKIEYTIPLRKNDDAWKLAYTVGFAATIVFGTIQFLSITCFRNKIKKELLSQDLDKDENKVDST